MSNVIDLHPPRRAPVDTFAEVHHDLAEARQELQCALTVLSLAEDRGFPAAMAERMATALRVAERCYTRINDAEDRLDALSVQR